MKPDYHKYHGLGNDYIVIDPNNSNFKPLPENIKLICHRNYGIGSDGILYGPIRKNGQIELKIFNPDGSEAEKSGNGLRIFSRYIFENNFTGGEKNFKILTKAGLVESHILCDDSSLIRISMGKAEFNPEKIPVTSRKNIFFDERIEIKGRFYLANAVSIGNPHCVIFFDDLNPDLLKIAGPVIENLPIFPNRTNVQFVKILDRNNIQIEIWERGAGYTLASGSSSCAAAAASFKKGLADNDITVHMAGGKLSIAIDNDFNIDMTGPVEAVSSGYFSGDLLKKIR